MPPDSYVEVAIVGAGAAGLAAASALTSLGVSVLVLEARDRIGGRALTHQLRDDIVFDVGCEWLHSADQNKFVPIAKALGFEIGESAAHWTEQSFNIGFPIEQQRDFYATSAAFEERLQQAAELPNDTPAARWLQAGNKWNPLIDAVSTYLNGAELSHVSVHDGGCCCDSNLNCRIASGYGALIRTFGSRCEVALDTEVRTIDHTGHDVRLDCARGSVRPEA